MVHVAVHSFTPKLDGVVRNADIGFLYDSRRKGEAELCAAAGAQSCADSIRAYACATTTHTAARPTDLTTWLRRRHPQTRYLGVELEINQALVGAKGWRRFQEHVAQSLRELVPSR